jgi:hypothetical protein
VRNCGKTFGGGIVDMQEMTSKKRMLTALERRCPDRLPVTTHHVMDYFLRTYVGGADVQAFFEKFGLDAIRWVVEHKPDESAGESFDPRQGKTVKQGSDCHVLTSSSCTCGLRKWQGGQSATLDMTFSLTDG